MVLGFLIQKSPKNRKGTLRARIWCANTFAIFARQKVVLVALESGVGERLAAAGLRVVRPTLQRGLAFAGDDG